MTSRSEPRASCSACEHENPAGDQNGKRTAASHLDEAERIIESVGARALLPGLWEIRASFGASASRSPVECLNRALDLHREFGSPLRVARIGELLSGLDHDEAADR
jgi:hypothetical protein